MPVQDFDGDTFVAFTDISGFKEMMKGDGQRAIKALGRLNEVGYYALRKEESVNGFFISDCGILFVNDNSLEKNQKLKKILTVIEEINSRLLDNNFMLTTSISYGHFRYQRRIEFNGIEKNPLYGNAYVSAYLDNEKGNPKLQPGQCRILSGDIEESSIHLFEPRLRKKGNHYYFYWMLDDIDDYHSFEAAYNDSYQLKYRGMLSALKKDYAFSE